MSTNPGYETLTSSRIDIFVRTMLRKESVINEISDVPGEAEGKCGFPLRSYMDIVLLEAWRNGEAAGVLSLALPSKN